MRQHECHLLRSTWCFQIKIMTFDLMLSRLGNCLTHSTPFSPWNFMLNANLAALCVMRSTQIVFVDVFFCGENILWAELYLTKIDKTMSRLIWFSTSHQFKPFMVISMMCAFGWDSMQIEIETNLIASNKWTTSVIFSVLCCAYRDDDVFGRPSIHSMAEWFVHKHIFDLAVANKHFMTPRHKFFQTKKEKWTVHQQKS